MGSWLWVANAAALLAVRALVVIMVEVSRRRAFAIVMRAAAPGTVWFESRPDGSFWYYGDVSEVPGLTVDRQ